VDVDVERVAADLQASLIAHRAALLARRNKDLMGARALLRDAAEWRRLAHTRDPEHTAPAWHGEQGQTPKGTDTHAAMVAFYEQQRVWNG